MSKFIITLNPGANYEDTKKAVESQGGHVVDKDDNMRDLGLMTVEMPESGATALQKSFSSDITIEPDQVVTTQ